MAGEAEDKKELEDYKADLQMKVERYKASLVSHQRQIEQTNDSNLAHWVERQKTRSDLFNSTIAAGQLVLKTLITVSGGALIAVLALIGNLSERPGEQAALILQAAEHGAPLFGISLIVAGLAVGQVYLAQACFTFSIYNEEDPEKFQYWNYVGNGFTFLCITLTLTSFVMFCIGGIETVPDRYWLVWAGKLFN